MMANLDSLRELIAGNSLFNKFEASHLNSLFDLIKETRTVEDGVFLVNEGEEASELFIVEKGSFEVLKQNDSDGSLHRLAVLGPGMSIGEVALFDEGTRSASIRALGNSTVFVFLVEDLQALSEKAESVANQMKVNLANEMSQRLRSTNEVTVEALQASLDEARTRAEMGGFVTRILFGICIYLYALGAMQALSRYIPFNTLITAPVLVCFAIGLYLNLTTSRFPTSEYGFNTHNWRHAVREALLFSIPVLLPIILAKWLVIQYQPEFKGMPVFDFYESHNVSPATIMMAMLAYAVFAPIQEMISRSGVQSALEKYLTSKHKRSISILISTILFSSTHIHISLTLAVLVFPLGLFWGWLYSRNPTLIGVSVSHIFLGWFALFVVGFTLPAAG
jgi:CRP-like cAMP-binding protein